MEVSSDRLSVNAYDVFLLRILSSKGIINVDYFSEDNKLRYRDRQKLSKKRLRPRAHAPALAALTESAIRDALKNSLELHRRGTHQRARIRQIDESAETDDDETANDTVLLIDTPDTLHNIPEALRKSIAASYGFRGLPALTENAVLRIVQRGFYLGLPSLTRVVAGPGNTRVRKLNSGSCFHGKHG